MLRVVILCAIFISSCVLPAGCQNDVGYGPPRLLFETSDTKQVNATDSFKLECESDRPVHWTYPMLTISSEIYEEVGSEAIVDITNSKTSTGQYQSVLSVTFANYMDTGNYSCIANDTSDDAASIYVYVKDLINLLVKNETFIVLPVTQFEAAVLPCRPTSPEVTVTLMRENSEVQPGIQESDSKNVTYDPKIGFILNPVNIADNGIFTCVAKLRDTVEEVSCHIDVLKVTTSIPKPTINDSVVHPVVAGGTLYLECVGLAMQGVKFSLKWYGPNGKEITKDDEYAEIVEPVLYKKCGKETYTCVMTSLRIRNVRMSDAGNYTCFIRDHNSITNSEIQEIKIHEPGNNYINLTHDGLYFNVTSKKPNVTWIIHVESSVTPSFQWLNQHSEEINYRNSMNKYNIVVSKKSQQVMLVIYDVQVKDAGTYYFIAYHENLQKTLNLSLIVREKPTVDILNTEGNAEMYYQLGKNYTMECKVVSYPAPSVKWSFLSCDLKSECNEADFKTLKSVSDTEFDKKTSFVYQYSSTFVWTVTKPGRLKCYADNAEGNGYDEMSISVTDIPDEKGLNIWGKPDKVVEGETITLYCGAIKYNYSDDISWYEGRVGYESKYAIENKSDEQFVIRNDSLYSYRAELTLLNLKLGADANYSCMARKSEDGISETIEEVITVLAAKKPRIFSTNLNKTEMMVNTGNKVNMYCRADGLPVPIVKWYKDNTPLQNNSRIIIDGEQLNIPFAKLEDEGDYRCDVTNRLATVSRSISLKFKDKPGVNLALVITIIVCVIVLVIMIIVLVMKIYKERKLRKELDVAGLSNFVQGAMENINPELPVDDQAELLPYDKKWEFPRDKLKLGKQLGSGAFGVVMKGEAWGIIDGELKSTVAVKMVKRNADRTYIKALASELKIMIHLGKHLNVVNLLGACTKNLAKMELLVIVEYCRFGNLHNYLLRHREEFVDQIDPKTGDIDPTIGMEILSRKESIKSNTKLKYASLSFSNSSGAKSDSGGMPVDYRAACTADSAYCTSDSLGMDTEMNLISLTPTGEHDEFILSNNSAQPEWRSNYRGDYKGTRPICTRDLLCFAFQVARGMEYLASRKVLHGDLAARNILLADDNVVKICDFGLAKSMYKSDNYHKKGDGPLPVKWMAVESIRDRVFSTQSDVWSFGIVLWEFFSLARTPYPGMEADEKLYNKLAGGYRMERPQYSTADIYSVMMKCWEARPVNRPTFSDLTERLGSMLEDSVRRHYIDLNDPYMDMNAQWLQGLENDYLSMMNAPTYGNMVSPSHVDDEDEREYVNGLQQAESGGESSGYLCMKSPTPEDVIFSPRKKETNIFRFSPHLQNQRRLRNAESEEAGKPEQKPMLNATRNSSESDIELDEMEKGSSNKEEGEQSERRKESEKTDLQSFSNPTYQSVIPIMPSDDNYVNMPQQKKSNQDKLRNISESLSTNTEFSDRFPSPTELTSGEQSKFQNSFSNPNYQSQIKSHDAYVNIPNNNRRLSDASSGFQSDVGEGLLVN